jgi:phosphatidylinositol alpha 1,6-mannosyltransferase
VRVAIIAECFLPEVNGVTNSVLRVIEHLERCGHNALVIAPGCGPASYRSTPVERIPAVRLPVYKTMSVGLPTGQVRHLLAEFDPDVVHLAAPAVLGAAGARAARLQGIPTLAVYQTDLAGFARQYGFGVASPLLWRWLRWIHDQTDLTLAPSTPAMWELRRHRIGPVAHWARGVDLERWHPHHRSELLHRRLARAGETLIGYVGRLGKEKQIHQLRHLRRLPGARLVVVGDGPARAELEAQLPGVKFLGFQTGAELSQTVASLDVMVHTGVDETFCQSIQEAMAAGVPVVAPASGGPLDLIHHGENGWLYPAAKPRLLRGAVEALVKDPVLRKAMGERARASVERRTWQAIGDELIAYYAHLTGLDERSRRAA